MSRFEDMINERAKSQEWGRNIAEVVLYRKAALERKIRLLLSVAASIAVIAGAGIFYQTNQKSTFRTTFDYVLSETVAGSNENTLISRDIDNNIIQYCMATE